MKRSISAVLITLFIMCHILTGNDGFVKYNYARSCPASRQFDLKVNGEEVFVYHTSAGDFAAFGSDNEVAIEVEYFENLYDVFVLPRRLNIEPELEENRINFNLPAHEKILIEVNTNDGKEQLFIYSNEIVKKRPNPDSKGMHYFKGGQIYEVGTLELQDNETLFIEAGAVVRGRVRVNSAKNITIAGNGVLDGSYYSKHGTGGHFVRIKDCQNAEVKDIIMIEPPGWMLVLYHSENVKINNIKQLGRGHGTDGIDIVASRKIKINNCILRNGDDCIVVKSTKDRTDKYGELKLNEYSGPQDIVAAGCAVQANGGGQAFEIGHELRLNPVKDITFKDCDVLGVHGQGGVFGIHNAESATVSNVTYKNIRVDHYYNKLIDIRIIESRWSTQKEDGHVKNVRLENIHVTNSIYNPGYSISLIGGYNEEHKVKNVTIKDFYIDGKKITNPDQLDLFTKQVEDVIIK